MTLFIERGYDEVTVADIAERAGLTKRSFFNHFADKREAVFASVDALQESVLAALAEADPALGPLDAAVWAFARAAAPVEDYPDLARARQALIDSCPELQERDFMKKASMASAVAAALECRGVPGRSATFAAQAAISVFTTALDDWVHEPERGLAPSIQSALDDLRTSLGSEDRLASQGEAFRAWGRRPGNRSGLSPIRRCRFSSHLASGRPPTWGSVSLLTDLATDHSHRSGQFLNSARTASAGRSDSLGAVSRGPAGRFIGRGGRE